PLRSYAEELKDLKATPADKKLLDDLSTKNSKVAASVAKALAGYDGTTDIVQQANAAQAKIGEANKVLDAADMTEFDHLRDAIGDLLKAFNNVTNPTPQQDKEISAAFPLGNNNRKEAVRLWNDEKKYSDALKLLNETLDKLRAIHTDATKAAEQAA